MGQREEIVRLAAKYSVEIEIDDDGIQGINSRWAMSYGSRLVVPSVVRSISSEIHELAHAAARNQDAGAETDSEIFCACEIEAARAVDPTGRLERIVRAAHEHEREAIAAIEECN